MSDFFDRLGLPRRFALDAAALEREYLARSRAAHPDYHAAGGSADLAASLELSAALNEAYNTLRDPFRRAEYLLSLLGGPSASDHKQMPPAFLAEMMDFRERVEELQAGAPCGRAAAELRDEVVARYDGLMAEVAAGFAAPAPDLAKVRRLLNAAKTVRGLARDLDELC